MCIFYVNILHTYNYHYHLCLPIVIRKKTINDLEYKCEQPENSNIFNKQKQYVTVKKYWKTSFNYFITKSKLWFSHYKNNSNLERIWIQVSTQPHTYFVVKTKSCADFNSHSFPSLDLFAPGKSFKITEMRCELLSSRICNMRNVRQLITSSVKCNERGSVIAPSENPNIYIENEEPLHSYIHTTNFQRLILSVGSSVAALFNPHRYTNHSNSMFNSFGAVNAIFSLSWWQIQFYIIRRAQLYALLVFFFATESKTSSIC